MKVRRGPGNTTQENLISKFSEIHVKKNNSVNTVMYRKDSKKQEVVIENNVLVSDDSATPNTDASCNVIFDKNFYFFLNSKLPEELMVTKLKLNLISFLLVEKIEFVLQELKTINRFKFIENLIDGVYDKKHIHSQYDILEIKKSLIDSIRNQNQEIILKAKDSNGNIFSKTQSFDRSKITEHFISSIKCPINDPDTTNKDGFNSAEQIYFFIESVESEIEIPLIIESSTTITAADKKEIPITNIEIENKFYHKYNPDIELMEKGI